jgi:ribonuclease HII
MIQSNFDVEKELLTRGYGLIIGIDEAGRGPLAGPVVASAAVCRLADFVITEDKIKDFELVRDSKKLSAKQREKVFDFIQENFWVGVGICNHETIDRINILEATYLAAKMAVSDLLKKMAIVPGASKMMILFDGNKLIPNFSHEQRAIVGGDKIVKSISAASIVAKVTRDRMMLEMHEKYPQYGFDAHKGYGTKFHMEMIAKHGPCPIHRQSFEPMPTLAKRRK